MGDLDTSEKLEIVDVNKVNKNKRRGLLLVL